MELQTREKIIFALVVKHGQRFTDLLTTAKTNRDSLSRGITSLEKDKLIKKDGGLYDFTDDIKNPVLCSLKGVYTDTKKFSDLIDELKTDKNPIGKGTAIIFGIMKALIVLKLERYSGVQLTKRDKLEFELYSDLFDAIIETIFDILRKKNKPRQIENLKLYLTNLLCGRLTQNNLKNNNTQMLRNNTK